MISKAWEKSRLTVAHLLGGLAGGDELYFFMREIWFVIEARLISRT